MSAADDVEHVHDAQHYKPDGVFRPSAPSYARDLVGYGRKPPHPRWPGDARIAVQFVINYEEVRMPLQAAPCIAECAVDRPLLIFTLLAPHLLP